MPLQKRRMGPSRIHSRRSAWMRRASRKPLVVACPECGEPRIQHRVCLKCGVYNRKKVMEVKQEEE